MKGKRKKKDATASRFYPKNREESRRGNGRRWGVRWREEAEKEESLEVKISSANALDVVK